MFILLYVAERQVVIFLFPMFCYYLHIDMNDEWNRSFLMVSRSDVF